MLPIVLSIVLMLVATASCQPQAYSFSGDFIYPGGVCGPKTITFNSNVTELIVPAGKGPFFVNGTTFTPPTSYGGYNCSLTVTFRGAGVVSVLNERNISVLDTACAAPTACTLAKVTQSQLLNLTAGVSKLSVNLKDQRNCVQCQAKGDCNWACTYVPGP